MRALPFFLSFLAGCADPKFGTDDTADTADTGDYTDSTSGTSQEVGAPKVKILLGYCTWQTSANGGEWEGYQTENVADGQDPVTVEGDAGDLLQIFCDWSVVPQYSLPQVEVTSGCAQTYCDGAETSDRSSCQDPDDVWAYVYAPGVYSGSCDENSIGF